MSLVEERIVKMGLVLPEAAAPAAKYLPWRRAGALIYVAGQLPSLNGELLYKGKLGDTLAVEDGYKAARLVALNLLAQVKAAVGDLDKVRAVKLNGFVNSAPDFTAQPQVINGASELLVDLMGDAGYHARAAVGVASLPFGVGVEIDAIFELVD
ncbi:MAG: RidA family protein [Deltaproteobacteria bacterium]|nr:RidA family protein [Deltaproteobacteria bacterium]